MRSTDLCAEFGAALAAVMPPVSKPVPGGCEAAGEAALIGWTQILVVGHRYQPERFGEGAYITPVVEMRGDLGPLQEAPAHGGETVDLVAWHPAHPERWALRTGVGRTLGYVGWWQAEKPTRVWRSPLAWLRARCDGIVLLTDDVGERHSILMQLRGGIVAEDRRHAAELRAICERPFTAPRIGVA